MDHGWTTQLRKGLVELAVLAALRRHEAYGYQLLQRINARPGLNLNEATVYPLLARLTREGCLTTRTADSPQGPPRRYYQLTEAGIERYEKMLRMWRAASGSLEQLIGEASK
ncbi:MAG: PadR family transcriptional regulator [Phycisphaeraceae bacterium]|nr:PadR family transcriptional regulator [Phycisphaeraceae bacterium]